MIDHSSERRFSIGRAGQGHAVDRPAAGATARACLVERVLDVLRLVQDDVAPAHLRQVVDVAPHQAIGADHQIVLAALCDTDRSPSARPAPWCTITRSVGRKAGHLALPVAHQRGRADHQRRRHVGLLPSVVQQQRDGLDRLAQAHVVGQAGAKAPAPQEGQPGEAAHLIGPQLARRSPAAAATCSSASSRVSAFYQLVQPSSSSTSPTARPSISVLAPSARPRASRSGSSPCSRCFSQKAMAAST